MTRVPVEVKDSPGFLVNMGGRAYTTEALRIVHEGVATPEQVDAIMRDCWGFRMGPFELMDLTGIDVNYPVSQIIWEGYGYDPRLKTSPNHKAMFDAGLYGRKTGQGWFKYENGKALDRPERGFQDGCGADHEGASRRTESRPRLRFVKRLAWQRATMGPVLGAPVGLDATHRAVRSKIERANAVLYRPYRRHIETRDQ